MKRISINIIATNKYIGFVEDLAKSIDSLFFRDCEISVIIHTNVDLPVIPGISSRISFHKNTIEHEPWPFTTLKRFHYFKSAKDIIEKSDYSFYVDADSLFVGNIESSLLPNSGMIGTIHPCLFNGPGTPERNPISKAYIPHGSSNRYFCGGFFGGSTQSFMDMTDEMVKAIEYDLSNDFIALWHDESHINRYFYENPPSVVLDIPFAVAESLAKVYSSSGVLFLDKNLKGGHDFFRN